MHERSVRVKLRTGSWREVRLRPLRQTGKLRVRMAGEALSWTHLLALHTHTRTLRGTARSWLESKNCWSAPAPQAKGKPVSTQLVTAEFPDSF